jgi:multisubunit Na+/H+ antiporter MnhF subunit
MLHAIGRIIDLEQALLIVLYLSLLVHVLLMVVVAYRLWNGENVIDRLMASDMLSNLTLAVLVLMGLIYREMIYIDVVLGLAALGYITIIAFSKYITDRQIF